MIDSKLPQSLIDILNSKKGKNTATYIGSVQESINYPIEFYNLLNSQKGKNTRISPYQVQPIKEIQTESSSEIETKILAYDVEKLRAKEKKDLGFDELTAILYDEIKTHFHELYKLSIFLHEQITYYTGKQRETNDSFMIAGSIGSGKSYLHTVLSEFYSEIPCVMINSTSLSDKGIEGATFEREIANQLINKSYKILKYENKTNATLEDVEERAKHGIVFIDEIDKISPKLEKNNFPNLYMEMIGILEGNQDLKYELAKNKTGYIKSDNLTFIALGSFEKFLSDLNSSDEQYGLLSEIGDCLDEKNEFKYSSIGLETFHVKDIFPREFMGRFSDAVGFDPLDFNDLKRIVYETNVFRKMYDNFASNNKINLNLEEDCFDDLIKNLLNKKGARLGAALRNRVKRILTYLGHDIKDKNLPEYTLSSDGVKILLQKYNTKK